MDERLAAVVAAARRVVATREAQDHDYDEFCWRPWCHTCRWRAMEGAPLYRWWRRLILWIRPSQYAAAEDVDPSCGFTYCEDCPPTSPPNAAP